MTTQALSLPFSRRRLLGMATVGMIPLISTSNAAEARSSRGVEYASGDAGPGPQPPVRAFHEHGLTIMDNGFIRIEFDPHRAAITTLSADYFGRGHYRNNLLGSDGIRLETVRHDGKTVPPKVLTAGPKTTLTGSPDIRLRLPVMVPADEAAVRSQWIITLKPGARWFELHMRTDIPNSAAAGLVRVRVSCNQWFFNALYQRGNVQLIEGQSRTFCSRDPLDVFYTMDCENGSISIVPQKADSILENNLFSGTVNQWGASSCGLDQVLCGASHIADQWIALDEFRPVNRANPAGGVINASFRLYASDQAFPVHTLPADVSMEFKDLAAFYTAVYGSSAGVLGSYAIPGSAYPNLATPNRPYGDGNSFFDPDAWSTVTTLSYSGDPLLARLARQVVERSARHMTADGQIPHNFNGTVPSLIAISGATQSGPNVFWTLACFDYAMGTGDERWLKRQYPVIKKAVEWLLYRYDPKVKLVKFTGSLFVDVFIRYGYTLDTNMAVVGLLDRIAPVSEFCGDTSGARRYRQLQAAISEGIRTELWNGKDHFVTQRNTNGTVRDMVDYDGNFGALAFGVVDDAAWRTAMFYRLDSGSHTHPGGRGTWVSQKYYGASDCYKGNTGDSATAMGRIWWLDMLARHRYPNSHNRNIFNLTYDNIRGDLLANTWLTERYGVRGQRIRTNYYHEYPEIVSMVMRTMRYGIDVRMDRVVIRPIEPMDFDFQAGLLRVSYRRQRVNIHVPGRRKLMYQIFHLMPNTTYRISNGAMAKTDAEGVLAFHARAGMPLGIRL